jgi:gamma-glutamylcyclotransferase (GGCT)/AIG2-like uncharacterized protein YtfP
MYFAYGMNLNVAGMAKRCPRADRVGAACIEDYTLDFKGVADIEDSPGDRVHGALWAVTPECIEALHTLEGYPRLYRIDMFTAQTGDGPVACFAYVMNYGKGSSPGDSYVQMIRDGYKFWGLPESELDAAVYRADNSNVFVPQHDNANIW